MSPPDDFPMMTSRVRLSVRARKEGEFVRLEETKPWCRVPPLAVIFLGSLAEKPSKTQVFQRGTMG